MGSRSQYGSNMEKVPKESLYTGYANASGSASQKAVIGGILVSQQNGQPNVQISQNESYNYYDSKEKERLTVHSYNPYGYYKEKEISRTTSVKIEEHVKETSYFLPGANQVVNNQWRAAEQKQIAFEEKYYNNGQNTAHLPTLCQKDYYEGGQNVAEFDDQDNEVTETGYYENNSDEPFEGYEDYIQDW